MYEVEIKIKLVDEEKVRKTLISMGAKKQCSMTHVDTYYNSPENLRDFSKTDEALRLRSTTSFSESGDFHDEGEQSHESHDLTYKGPKLDTELKTRIEHVCILYNPEEIDKIILALGFKHVLTLSKDRESYHVDFEFRKIEILIDKIEGLSGSYLEAELMVSSDDEKERDDAKEIIFKFIEALGYSRKDSITESYLELVLKQ